jgi:hypothetical protein
MPRVYHVCNFTLKLVCSILQWYNYIHAMVIVASCICHINHLVSSVICENKSNVCALVGACTCARVHVPGRTCSYVRMCEYVRVHEYVRVYAYVCACSCTWLWMHEIVWVCMSCEQMLLLWYLHFTVLHITSPPYSPVHVHNDPVEFIGKP